MFTISLAALLTVKFVVDSSPSSFIFRFLPFQGKNFFASEFEPARLVEELKCAPMVEDEDACMADSSSAAAAAPPAAFYSAPALSASMAASPSRLSQLFGEGQIEAFCKEIEEEAYIETMLGIEEEMNKEKREFEGFSLLIWIGHRSSLFLAPIQRSY